MRKGALGGWLLIILLGAAAGCVAPREVKQPEFKTAPQGEGDKKNGAAVDLSSKGNVSPEVSPLQVNGTDISNTSELLWMLGALDKEKELEEGVYFCDGENLYRVNGVNPMPVTDHLSSPLGDIYAIGGKILKIRYGEEKLELAKINGKGRLPSKKANKTGSCSDRGFFMVNGKKTDIELPDYNGNGQDLYDLEVASAIPACIPLNESGTGVVRNYGVPVFSGNDSGGEVSWLFCPQPGKKLDVSYERSRLVIEEERVASPPPAGGGGGGGGAGAGGGGGGGGSGGGQPQGGTKPPEVVIHSPVNGKWYNITSLEPNYTVAGGNIKEEKLFLNGTEVGGLENLSDGWYNFTVCATNEEGLTGCDSVEFGIDTIPPEVKISSPKREWWNRAEIRTDVNEDSNLSYSTGGGWAPFSGNGTLVLPRGNITLSVKAVDRAGNSAEDMLNLTVYDVTEDLLKEVWRYSPVKQTFEEFLSSTMSSNETEKLINLQNYKPNPINVMLSQIDNLTVNDTEFIDFVHNATKEINEKEILMLISQPDINTGTDRGDAAFEVFKKYNDVFGTPPDPKIFLSAAGGTSLTLLSPDGAVRWLSYLNETLEARKKINATHDIPFLILGYLTTPVEGYLYLLNPPVPTVMPGDISLFKNESIIASYRKIRDTLFKDYRNVTEELNITEGLPYGIRNFNLVDFPTAPYGIQTKLGNNNVQVAYAGGFGSGVAYPLDGRPYGDVVNETTGARDDIVTAVEKLAYLLDPNVSREVDGNVSDPRRVQWSYHEDPLELELAIAEGIPAAGVYLFNAPNDIVGGVYTYTWNGTDMVLGEAEVEKREFPPPYGWPSNRIPLYEDAAIPLPYTFTPFLIKRTEIPMNGTAISYDFLLNAVRNVTSVNVEK